MDASINHSVVIYSVNHSTRYVATYILILIKYSYKIYIATGFLPYNN